MKWSFARWGFPVAFRPLKNLGESAALDVVAPQLRRSRRLASALKAVALATPEAPVVFDHFAEAGQPLLVAAVISAWREAGNLDSAVWVLCSQVKAQEVMQSELGVWGHEALFLPEYEWAGFEETLPDPESAAERLAVLKEIHEVTCEKGDAVVVLTAESLGEGAPPPGSLSRQAERMRPKDRLVLKKFGEILEKAGYEPEAQVFQRGQFALRGGIIDVFSWHALHPVRIELFDDEIESIREFDVDAQTSIGRVDSCEILLSEANLELSGRISDYLGEGDLIIAVDCDSEFAHIRVSSGLTEEVSGPEDFDGACFDNPLGEFGAGDFILQEARREEFSRQIAAWRKDKWTVLMAFHSDGEKERFTELIFEKAWKDGFLKPMIGTLSRGFTIPDAKLAVLSDAEIFGRYQNQRGRRRYRLARELQASKQVSSLREYNYGDLVVHIDYGIGKFKGIRTRDVLGNSQEVLEIEYDESARLFVQLDQAHLISRYIGTGKNAPKLSRLGDKRWSRIRRDAENSILDYAGRLLSIQAERASHRGFAHPADNKWQWEFEHAFIYKETPDQMRAIEEAKTDMESEKPMDRLICGDVGFGKTEVAIRAAFKAVMSGKQVAILAPTTVLAEQHFRNFRERMSDFPVQIEALSRYRTPAEQRTTLANLISGKTDIVIGTHRVISKDVQFKNLGLVVVDEEQRFGVHHKERFKEMWRFVDVLTLSATPIPRTLYLSMMGVREMSIIDTPPPNRRPVATTVCPYDERIIRSAIEKELARQGQVFFLHNRVKSIQGVKRRIEDLVPGARVEVGHGQMESDQLEDVMSRFIRHEFDVLVCTTIIESGVDIPNANTIMIDRADRFGLADLYQIRGRVGRADRRAYAYLMLPPDMLTVGDARKRINAIKQYSSLGAGFKIAMRDLEIRGAGNLLGTQQSGHIAAIGFDLYCQLLKQSVSKLKGEPAADRIDLSMHVDFLCTNEARYLQNPADSLPAYIPSDYMPEARLRITAYRELAEASRVEDLDLLRANWEDRFGHLPEATVHLLASTEIKIRAALKGCSALEIQDQKLKLTKNGNYIQINGKFPRLIGDNEEEWLESALDWVLDL
ncbi:MAG: transcription-repair coupling factor [Verrucomicrobiales bacterium]|nr:transcription-repair coupling factor [Verrucomicrobiales bacterium]